jgi:PAS domain S-box-containing protein
MAGIYLVGANLGSWLSPRETYVSFWLPAGIYITALVVRSRRDWPWLALGAFLANAVFDLTRGTPLLMLCGFHVANILQAFGGAWILERWVSPRPPLNNVRAFFLLVAAAAIGPNALGALVGASTLRAFGASAFWPSFAIWWGSCALATLIILPTALAWFTSHLSHRKITGRGYIELGLICALIVFGGWELLVVGPGILGPHQVVILPLLLWSSARFGPRGATLTCCVLAFTWTSLTNHYQTGFTPETLHSGSYVLALQLFVAIATLVGLLPAIASAERDASLSTLRNNEERYRSLVNAALEGIVISENGVIRDANDQLLILLGYRRSDLIGRSLSEFLPLEGRQLESAPNTPPKSYELTLLRNDGSTFFAETQMRLVQQGDQQVRTIAIRDVSARREAEAAVRAGQAILRQFIAHAPAAIAMMDTEMRYLQHSQRWLTDYHLEGHEIVGRSHYDVFPDIPARWKELHARVLSGAVERCEEDPFPRDDGSLEWIQWEARPWRRADGAIGGLLLFTQVVTQRKLAEAKQQALEAQLRQAQKLDAVGTLAGGIAHDFNNILGAISAHAELAKLDAPEESEIGENLAGVLQATWRASQVVEQILTFSRKQPQERVVMRLGPVVREALKLLRSTLPSTIEIVKELHADAPAVCANSTHMHQVLVNLCTNAGHAMRGKPGTLTVALQSHVVDADEAASLQLPPGNYARLVVSDTGQGMNADVMQRIFDPFFSTKPQHEGTGLGLAVVHGIVQEHQGAIRVESRLGVGSSFRILLPSAVGDLPQPRETPQALPRGQGQRILIVDDERSLADSTRRLLQRMGYATTAFTRSTEAWVAFQTNANQFDLVITDLTMPEMDGLELSRRILGLRPECPVLMTTGSFNEETQHAAKALGIDQVLVKPVGHDNLIRNVARCLEPKDTTN